MYSDDDLAMLDAAAAADQAAATRGAPPFDRAEHGPHLRQYVFDAIDSSSSVYVATTQCATDHGFAHDEAADVYAFDCAQERKDYWTKEMRRAR